MFCNIETFKIKWFSRHYFGMPPNNFTPKTVDELNKRIDESLNDSHYGRLTENDDLMTEIKECR